MRPEPSVVPPTLRDDFLVFGKPVISDAEIAEVVASLRSGWIGTGPKVRRFERMLEEYLGVAHVRCVSSCTAALILGMRVLGVGPGDEVIVPAMTFVASANAVEHTGGTPILVDSEPVTGLIDLDAVAAAITPRTKAIMPVHLAGRPVDMDALNAIRDAHGLRGDRGRSARDRHGMARSADRWARQPRRLLLLRDEEHHYGRGWRPGHGRPRRRGAGGAARASRTQPRRLAALLGRRIQALRGGGAGLQVQHDRRPGSTWDPPAPATRRLDRPARRALGAL